MTKELEVAMNKIMEPGFACEAKADMHVHEWTDWKEVGRTGDWFHPLIVERKCKKCGRTETDEH